MSNPRDQEIADAREAKAQRTITPEEDTLIRRAHAGEIKMRDLTRLLRCSYEVIYRRMDALGLPRRKPDARRERRAA